MPPLCKITIMTTGSRGDIQPFVAIGVALKRAGYEVRVMTQPSKTHAMLLDDFGLEYVPFGIDADRFMLEDKEARNAMETGDTIKFFKCIGSLVENKTESSCKPFYDEFLAGEGENRPDFLLVSYLNRYFGLYAKHVLKVPTIEIKLQHWVFDDPTRAPMGMPTMPLGMHKLIQTKLMVPQDYKMFQQFDKCITEIIDTETAASSSKLEFSTVRLDDFLLYDQLFESSVHHKPLLPMMICQSHHFKGVLHPTLSTSPMLRFVGPAIIGEEDQIRGDTQSFGKSFERKKIQDFIASSVENKPVYMGWGSMIRKSTQEMAVFAVEALMMSSKRGIILGGSAGLSMGVLEDYAAAADANDDHIRQIIEYAKENVIFVDKAPHEWLFPQVSLTVHHGGAGTLNTALRAGVPTIVTPVFGDQYDNSFAVQNLKVGVGFERQLQKIDAKDLSAAIDAVTNDPAFATRAKEIGDEMRKEDGCTAIVDEIKEYWIEEVTTGRLHADINKWKLTVKEMKAGNKRKTLYNWLMFGLALVVASISFLLS